MQYSRWMDVFACGFVVGLVCICGLASVGLDVLGAVIGILLAICTVAARIMHFIDEDKQELLKEIRKGRGEEAP